LGTIFIIILNASEPKRHPEQTQQKVKSQTRQDLNKPVKNSLLYYRIFLITSIQVQVWIHLKRVIQVQVLILQDCVLPKRKSGGVHCRVPSCVPVMTLKQTIHQGWMSDNTENSREATSKKNCAPNRILKPVRRGRYQCQDCNIEDEVRSRGSQGISIR